MTLKHPTAWLPIAMSAVALAIVLGHIALFGVTRDVDEGTAAHLWQLLMAGQVPFILYHASVWLPRTPRRSLNVLAIQVAAALAALAPVYLLGL